MSLEAVSELLRELQNPKPEQRQAAEKKLYEAWEQHPDQLVRQLVLVLAAREAGPVEGLRQEAAVLLRQCVAGGAGREAIWDELEEETKRELKNQLILALQQDPSGPVRRNVGSAIAAAAGMLAEDFKEMQSSWPELLPGLSRMVGSEASQRISALEVLREMSGTIGDGLLAQGQALGMLSTCLSDATPAVRTAAARLVLQLIEDLDPKQGAVLSPLMPTLVQVFKSLCSSTDHEDLLKEFLESLIAAADEEPEFFKEHGLQELWPLLLQLCGVQIFADADVRHSAMEALMSFACGLREDFCKAQGQPFLEQLVALNVEWMLEVEEDVDIWSGKADADDDDDIDGDAVQIGEENMDRLAENMSEEDQMEEVFMPILFKVINAAQASTSATWKHHRATVMAVSQVIEHVEDESWIDRCVEFIIMKMVHPHPRVRFSAFQACGQAAYDHDPYVQESHHDKLIPAIITALDDVSIRVAANAANALSSICEEIDRDDLEPFVDELLTKLILRLQQGQTRTMQQECLSSIAVLAESAEDLFVPYYTQVMPVLKQIIGSSTSEETKVLRGKAFECASIIGDAVGPDIFTPDAHEVMQVMTKQFQLGFKADDPTRESVHEACGRIASSLKRGFKGYMPHLLPSIFEVLDNRPQPVDPEDADDENEDMSLLVAADGSVSGLKTSILQEMKQSLILICALLNALEDDYGEFLPQTCQRLLPLVEFNAEEVREWAFKASASMVDCARACVDSSKCDKTVLSQLVGQLLKTNACLMAQAPPADKMGATALGTLQAQAVGIAGIIRKAGPNVLAKEDVADLLRLLVDLMGRLSVEANVPAASKGKKSKPEDIAEDEESNDDDSDEEQEVTRQSVRFILADVVGALMRSNRADFAEVGLPTFIEVVRRMMLPEGSEADRSFALHLADDIVESMGELSVPFWNVFMEQACKSITDKCPVIRQYAANTIGSGSKQPIFAKIAPVAVQQVARIVQKFGERHRRRRAVTSDARELALSVDAAIHALGLICEHQEQNIGGDSKEAWRMWLNNLPLRYDQEAGQKAHLQLLELVVRGHSVVTCPGLLPTVLGVFADVYRTKFSNPSLDKGIAAAVGRAGAESVEVLVAGLPERQQKRVRDILKYDQ